MSVSVPYLIHLVTVSPDAPSTRAVCIVCGEGARRTRETRRERLLEMQLSSRADGLRWWMLVDLGERSIFWEPCTP